MRDIDIENINIDIYREKRLIRVIQIFYIPCNLLATTPLALSRGVSPSLLAMDTRAPAATNSSAIA